MSRNNGGRPGHRQPIRKIVKQQTPTRGGESWVPLGGFIPMRSRGQAAPQKAGVPHAVKSCPEYTMGLGGRTVT